MLSLVLTILILMTLALVALLSGPLLPMNPHIPQFTIPHDLEGYLKTREAAAGDVKPEQEKMIVWANPGAKAKTKLSIVYIHGFSASRGEISSVPEELAAELQANLFMTRLSGHGLKNSIEAIGQVSAQDFFTDAYEAMEIGRRLGEKVVVIGTSTGAMLALHSAKMYPDTHAVVILSPNFHPVDWRAKYASGFFGKWIARAGLGDYREFKTKSAEESEFWVPRYRSEGVVAMMDLLNYIARLDLGELRPPILTVLTAHDDVIDVGLVRKRVQEIRSAGSRVVDGTDTYSHHVLAGRILTPAGIAPLKAEIKTFLDEAGSVSR